MQWAATAFNPEGAMAIHILTGILVLGFLVAQFVPKKPIVGALLSTVLVLAAYFGIGTVEMTVNESASQATNTFVVPAILFATLMPFIIKELLKILSKWIPELNPSSWSVAVYPLLAGGAFLLSSLTAPLYGPMLVGTGFLINSFFDNKRSGLIGTSVFTLAMIPLLLVGESTSISILYPDVIAGLLIGAAAVVLLNKLWSGKRSVILVIAAYTIIFAVVFGMAFNGTIFPAMGGIDAFVAVLVSAALVNAVKGKSFQGVSLMAPLFALGLWVPALYSDETDEKEDKVIVIGGETDKDGNKVEGPEVLKLTELSGAYEIKPEASTVQFQLGPEGSITKGEFEKVSGTFLITDDLSEASVNVILDMADFSTGSKMRDKSLRGADYFKTDKFPKMKYSATGFSEVGENLYEAKGRFTMIGVSKEVTVSMQRIELEDKIVLIGSGTLDRTEFGMAPNASEGNVVDFNYQVELSQK
ncbi:MAG: hypothetical protein Crog4KO_10650 [Crocinitomicaceae bacterium]